MATSILLFFAPGKDYKERKGGKKEKKKKKNLSIFTAEASVAQKDTNLIGDDSSRLKRFRLVEPLC